MASLTRKDWMKIRDDLKSIYTFPSFMGSEDSTRLWFDSLSNYPVEHIRAAVKAWISGSNKEPTPSDIIDTIKKVAYGTVKRDSEYKFWKVTNLDGTSANDTIVDYAAFEWDASADEVRNWFLYANKTYDPNYTLAGKKIFPEERRQNE